MLAEYRFMEWAEVLENLPMRGQLHGFMNLAPSG